MMAVILAMQPLKDEIEYRRFGGLSRLTTEVLTGNLEGPGGRTESRDVVRTEDLEGGQQEGFIGSLNRARWIKGGVPLDCLG